MKKIYTLTVLAVLFAISLQAQRCDRYKKYCDIELKKFDYSTQSAFSHLYPGDTIPVKTVLYGNKEYHITVCSEHPQVNWKIVKPYRRTERSIKEIVRDTSLTYKTDEYDEYIVDPETGDYIVESSEITVDTVWASERVSDEQLIFDNSKEQDWTKKIKKTHRAFIYVTLPMDADPDGVCVAVFIGRNTLKKSKFANKSSTGDYYY